MWNFATNTHLITVIETIHNLESNLCFVLFFFKKVSYKQEDRLSQKKSLSEQNIL